MSPHVQRIEFFPLLVEGLLAPEPDDSIPHNLLLYEFLLVLHLFDDLLPLLDGIYVHLGHIVQEVGGLPYRI